MASWFVVKSGRHTVNTYTAVVLDLRNRLVLRGVPETGEQAQQPLMLLRGTNSVGVFEQPGTPLVSATGVAATEGSLTVLKAEIDPSKLNSGHYLLAIRLP